MAHGGRNIKCVRRLFAASMLFLACSVILLHAFVPHHHHDCHGEAGLVFEDEWTCHCDDECCDDRCCHDADGCEDSHHPFDLCKLQELLSQLVLNNKFDEYYAALCRVSVALSLPAVEVPFVDCDAPCLVVGCSSSCRYCVPHLHSPALAVSGLRAPPVC